MPLSFPFFLGLLLLFSVGFRLLLSQKFLVKIFGLCILSHATHLLLLFSGMTPPQEASIGTPPMLQAGKFEWMVDPLPQALILTSIVISFGIMAFLLRMLLLNGKEKA